MKNVDIENKLKETVDKLNKSDELLNFSYVLEKVIRHVGDRYVEINLDKASDDICFDKSFLYEEFEDRLRDLQMYECDNLY